MTTSGSTPAALRRVARLARWVADHDAVVVHGYSHPWMLLAGPSCRTRRVPYLLGVKAVLAVSGGLCDLRREFTIRSCKKGAGHCKRRDRPSGGGGLDEAFRVPDEVTRAFPGWR
jgi:hypothetical protein